MEHLVNKEDFEKFKDEVNAFNKLNEPITYTSILKLKLNLSDYLKWCEIQRMDKLIKLLEVKS